LLKVAAAFDDARTHVLLRGDVRMEGRERVPEATDSGGGEQHAVQGKINFKRNSAICFLKKRNATPRE
jgi:hypothetical protein